MSSSKFQRKIDTSEMATITFTSALKRFVGDVPTVQAEASTVGALLDEGFRMHPRLRSYILDDQGRLRENVVIFVDGAQIADPQRLSDPVAPESEVYVLQALSGG